LIGPKCRGQWVPTGLLYVWNYSVWPALACLLLLLPELGTPLEGHICNTTRASNTTGVTNL
jgi:hypothetical protein